MKKPAVTLEDLRQALATQDAQLAAAFAALDPHTPIGVPTASLQLLADACSSSRSLGVRSFQNILGSVRC